MTLVYIAVGGALGSVVRFLMASWVGRAAGNVFPYGTLAVNVVGGLLMGMLIGALARFLPENSADLRNLLAVGFLGGFTTFSAFSLDVVTLAERGEWGAALLYVLVSVLLSVLALAAGLTMFRSLPA